MQKSLSVEELVGSAFSAGVEVSELAELEMLNHLDFETLSIDLHPLQAHLIAFA